MLTPPEFEQASTVARESSHPAPRNQRHSTVSTTAGQLQTQGSRTFDSRGLARDFKHELLAQAAANAWVDPRRGRLLFDDWADHW